MFKSLFGLTLVLFGVLGGAITLFANRVAPPDMADWAWTFVAPWQEWTPEFWDWFAVRLGLALPNWLVPPLNIAAVFLLTAIGVRFVDQGDQKVLIDHPIPFLIGGMAAMFGIAYILLAGPSQASADAQSLTNYSLVIYLAAAAASFSPAFAGRGNLIKRLWFMVAGFCVLVALNEFTKPGVAPS